MKVTYMNTKEEKIRKVINKFTCKFSIGDTIAYKGSSQYKVLDITDEKYIFVELSSTWPADNYRYNCSKKFVEDSFIKV